MATFADRFGAAPPAGFDAEGARAAGYPEAIVRGVQNALAAGYSPAEISAHLSQPKPPAGFTLDKPGNIFADIPTEPSKKAAGLFDDIQPVAGKLGTEQPPWLDYRKDSISSDFQQQPEGPWRDFGSWRGDPVTSPAVPEGYVLDKAPHGVLANAADFVKSIPEGAARALRQYGRGHQIEAEFFNQPFTGGPVEAGPDLPTGLPLPQGKAGEYGQAVGEAIGNPLSYLGGGGIGLKAVAAALSALGGKAGEDTGLPGGRLIGGVLGGVTGAKTLSPKVAKAEIPSQAQLKDSADLHYTMARNSGLELAPDEVSNWAAGVEQGLNSNGYTGGVHGTAPKTLSAIQSLQNPGDAVAVTAGNLDTIRKTLGKITQETATDNRGVIKPTTDATAAVDALRDFRKYTETIPESHVLAGDPDLYASAITRANGDYAALLRTRGVGAKLGKAENAAARSIATTQGQQIQNKLASVLDNPKALSGLTPEETAQLQRINDGSFVSNTAKQIGRGAGVVPLLAHAAIAAGTGGTSLPWQLALYAGSLGARGLGSRLTVRQANKLDEMLRMRSPLYGERANALPPAQPSAVPGAVLRAIAAGQ